MLQLKKGLRLESLNLPFKKAIAIAAQIGATGIEIDARSQLKPSELSRTGARHLKKLLADHRLTICCVDFPTRRNFAVSEDLDRRIDATKAAMMMAYDLGCNVVSTQMGRIPDAESNERQTMVEAMEDIGRHGQRVGAMLAARTGETDGEQLGDFIKSLTPATLHVDFDPAGLLINGHGVEDGMRALGSYVMHFRARDAVRDLSQGMGVEVQLGRGSVDLPPLLAILEESAYQGFITVDRQPGENSIMECQQSLEFLDNVFA